MEYTVIRWYSKFQCPEGHWLLCYAEESSGTSADPDQGFSAPKGIGFFATNVRRDRRRRKHHGFSAPKGIGFFAT
jgi:hypothetical protein